MRTKTAIYGLTLLLFAGTLNSCAGSKKAKCSCPNFRGSRAIYGKVDVEVQSLKFKVQDLEKQ